MGLMDRVRNSLKNALEGVDDISDADAKKVYKSVKLIRETGPKVSAQKTQAAGLSISKSAAAANTALTKAGLLGVRFDAKLVLDHSYSMTSDYRNGQVQALVERALGYALQFDDEIEAMTFDDKVKSEATVTLDNYQGIVDSKLWKKSDMGGTEYVPPFEKIRAAALKSDKPLFVMFVTDGDPWNKAGSTKIVAELAGYPVFIKFLALGSENSYLVSLDDMPDSKRLLDNVDAKFYPSLSSVSDDQFAEDMADEWSSWIDLAVKAGVLTN